MTTYTEVADVDQITISSDGEIHVRTVVRILRDNVQIAQGEVHRDVLYPGQDLAAAPERARRVAQAVWTPDVVAAHALKREASRKADEARGGGARRD